MDNSEHSIHTWTGISYSCHYYVYVTSVRHMYMIAHPAFMTEVSWWPRLLVQGINQFFGWYISRREREFLDLHSENAVSTQAESGWVTSRCTLSQAYTVICMLTWRTPQIIDSSLPILYWSNSCEHLHCLFCTECLALYARRRSHGTEMLHTVMIKLHVLKAWSDYLFANTLV